MPDTATCRGYGDRHDCSKEVPEHLLEGGLCPKCRELQRIDAEERHQMTRDPTLEPY